jgi:hypothetical protein
MKNGVLECHLPVWLYPSLVTVQQWSLFVFNTEDFIHHRMVHSEYEHLAPKIRELQMNPKMAIFLRTVLTILITFHYFMETISQNKTAWAVS